MSESYKPNFEDGDEIKFIEKLWEYFIKSGWYTNPKNDICDFILYLFDKYDKEHFFTKNTLAQNERLLKMTATKIKSVKKNISIKFMDFDEYEKIFKEALENLIKKDNIKDENDEYYKIIIENPVERFALENDLKKFSNDTLEYGANNDISFIKKTSFF